MEAKMRKLRIRVIMVITLIITLINISKATLCGDPQYIKFKQGSAAFDNGHKAPATCSEIYQNGEHTAYARYGVSEQSGTSPGSYERSLSVDNVEWENWTKKSFSEKCQQTLVDWKNDDVDSTNWEVTYKFTAEPLHSTSYNAQFTTGTPQKEGLTV